MRFLYFIFPYGSRFRQEESVQIEKTRAKFARPESTRLAEVHGFSPRRWSYKLQPAPLEFMVQPAQLGAEHYLAHATMTASANHAGQIAQPEG